MAKVLVRPARPSDQKGIAEMQALLWPVTSLDDNEKEIASLLSSGVYGTLPGTILVAVTEDSALIGFVAVSLRSHADGCDPAHPVGFIEGWFVAESLRKRGVGKQLIGSAEEWARTQGCVEMASDALIDNEPSQRAQIALGFEIVDRCVNFRKRL
jgi:aminoglycoside 6'-N-acetyltransferase I